MILRYSSLRRLSAYTTLALLVAACALFTKNKDNKSEEDEEVVTDEEAQVNAEEKEGDEQEQAAGNTDEEGKPRKKKLPHPIIPDAWHTNKLVMTKMLPDKKLLNNCRSDLNVIGGQISNEEAMVLAIQSMRETVKKKQEFYHWCFYYSMTALDWGLENETKRALIQDQQEYFHRNMRGLFVLGRALDQSRKTKKYFYYIRRRYVELSQNYFGRTLDVLAPPVDVVVHPIGKPEPREKPAGPSPADR